MRITLVFAILGLLIVEGLLLPRTVRDSKMMRKMRADTAPEVGLPASLGPFAGYDTEGRPLTLVTDGTRWILPVVIHSKSATSDLDYLGRLKKAIHNTAFVFVGVCDTNLCGDVRQLGRATPEFPLLAYGSYAPLSEIERFDGRNEILLMNQFWGVKQSLRRASSPEDLAAEIQKVTQ
jgi:hypothetical protein